MENQSSCRTYEKSYTRFVESHVLCIALRVFGENFMAGINPCRISQLIIIVIHLF